MTFENFFYQLALRGRGGRGAGGGATAAAPGGGCVAASTGAYHHGGADTALSSVTLLKGTSSVTASVTAFDPEPAATRK